MTLTDTSDLKPKTRVVATTRLPGVPRGTAGRLGRAVGLSLTRYRVAFDNGVDLTSVTDTKLVKEDEWDAWQQQEAEAAAAGADGPATDAAPDGEGADDGGAGPADDRLAALLAKSKAAKAKKLGDESGGATEPEPAAEAATDEGGDAAPADDRLAALLAKSKAAKAKKLAEG